MKTSALKIIKSWLNKTNFYNSKNYFNKKTISIGIPVIFILVILSYFLRPMYFEYEADKKKIQDKINNIFKLHTNIRGAISYKIFPSPRIMIDDVNLHFDKSNGSKIKVNKLYILISPLKIKNLDSFELKKILITDQKIRIYPKDLKKYFKYFANAKESGLVFKNLEIFFLDAQGNRVVFHDVNLEEKFSYNKHQIKGSANFSKNKIKIKFFNKIGLEKYLKINFPDLKQSLNIKFDPESNLKNLSGELKLNIFETVLLLNFKGKDNFKISKSYIRNKFLNSKIDGIISFKDEFHFDLNMGVNQINLRKLLLYYPIFKKNGISKKINGKFNILIKSTDSFFGKIRNAKMLLKMENGDIKIQNASALFPENTKVQSNISILNTNKGPIIEFSINFLTNNSSKFFRKFGLYDFEKEETILFLDGSIDVNKKKMNLKKIVKDSRERVSSKETSLIENSFNQLILNEGIEGMFDFIKFKKFLQENY